MPGATAAAPRCGSRVLLGNTEREGLCSCIIVCVWSYRLQGTDDERCRISGSFPVTSFASALSFLALHSPSLPLSLALL
jgi:hypothetical protein